MTDHPENFDDESGPDEAPPQPAPASRPTESPEHHVIGACLLDEGSTLDAAILAGLAATDFSDRACATIFSRLVKMRSAGTPIGLDTLTQELGPKELRQIGGIQCLMELADPSRVPTTARAAYFIRRVLDDASRRGLARTAKEIAERAERGESIDDLHALIARLGPAAPRITYPQRQPSTFSIPGPKDQSILLGNRYLNRGDGMILSGPSGMGKSSIQLQAAACWALGRDFHGILPNGPQKSLIIQSEDSDGDIAEVWASILHVMEPTLEERVLLDTNLRIVTDRVNRGTRFVAALKAHLAAFSPDLVWLNPLQAFIEGDVTDSQDIGAFLREGLNGLNSDSRFGYIIIHHTTKPATGKDRSERLWHEVMYDMAGGAELINWARAIISLRPTATEGEFKLVLAKRGRRAGVVKMVEAGVGLRPEPVTVIGLRHAQGFLPGTSIPIIFWEPCSMDESIPEDSKPGKKEKFRFSDFSSVFPKADSKGMALNELHRAMEANVPIKKNSMFNILKRWEEDGFIEIIREPGQPMRYRSAQ